MSVGWELGLTGKASMSQDDNERQWRLLAEDAHYRALYNNQGGKENNRRMKNERRRP